MQSIHVRLTFPDREQISCGEILCEEPDSRGRAEGVFRYSEDYLNHPAAFPLDPAVLPLSPRTYHSERPSGIFAVFEDSLPDDWGRRLLIRKAGLQSNRQRIPDLLLAIGGNAMGALSFYPEAGKTMQEPHTSVFQLDILLAEIEKYESGSALENAEIMELLRAGSSPGGARPKALVTDEDGRFWIAKFPSIKDRYAVTSIEHASMLLAREAGVPVPETELKKLGRHKVLLVKRFDVTGTGGRYHVISFQTLLQAEGWYHMSYRDLAGIVKLYSSRPEVDLVLLFLQMTFNAFMGNTDDHLKNFSMLYSEDGYRLSPAFDLLPDVNDNRNHVLNFDLDPFFPGADGLVSLGKKYFGISRPARYVSAVKAVLKNWKQVFKASGVPSRDIERLSTGIDGRLAG